MILQLTDEEKPTIRPFPLPARWRCRTIQELLEKGKSLYQIKSMLEPSVPVGNIHERWQNDQPFVQRLEQRLGQQLALDRFFLDFPELKWVKEKPPKAISRLLWYRRVTESSWSPAALGISKSLAQWLLEPEQELLRHNWTRHEGTLDAAITDQFRQLKTLETDPKFRDSTEIELHRKWVMICNALKATSSEVHERFEQKTGLRVTQERLAKLRKGRNVAQLKVRYQLGIGMIG